MQHNQPQQESEPQRKKKTKHRKIISYHANYVPSIFAQTIKSKIKPKQTFASYAKDKISSLFVGNDKDKPDERLQEIILIKHEMLEIRKILATRKKKHETINRKELGEKLCALEKRKHDLIYETNFKDDLLEPQRTIKSLKEELKPILKEISNLKADDKPIPLALTKRKRDVLEKIDLLELQKVEKFANNIREHAAMRFDLFFLLLVAVYKTNVAGTKGWTPSQFGSGTQDIETNGCHDALFPFLYMTDNPPEPSNTYKAINYIWQLIRRSAPAQPGPTPEPVEHNILKDKHFAYVSNMTTEAPKTVNKFDCKLEMAGQDRSALVRCAVEVINQVSRGELTPVQGLDAYCKIMYRSFQTLKDLYIEPPADYSTGGPGKIPKTFKKIWEYEREGTFHAIDEGTLTANRKYINQVLAIDKLSFMQACVDKVTGASILAKQNEILTSTFRTPAEEVIYQRKLAAEQLAQQAKAEAATAATTPAPSPK